MGGFNNWTRNPPDFNTEVLLFVANLGGVSRREAVLEGFDPYDLSVRVGLQWVFRHEGGKTFDALAELLHEAGYIAEYDKNLALDLITNLI